MSTSVKLKELQKNIQSGDKSKIKKAIKALEKNGNASVIKNLADVLLTNDTELSSLILELFSSFKDSSVTAEVMDVIDDPKYIEIRHDILVTIWNTKVDFSDYLDDFVEIATTGSFMDAVECLTIIENLEGPFLEESILESQLHLKNYIESDLPKDEQKNFILSEIAVLIKAYNENMSDI